VSRTRRRLALLVLSTSPLAPACDGCWRRDVIVGAVDPVARCTDTSGDVRRRLSEGSAWSSLGSGADLYSGDWVQTAQRARAQIEFEDGSELLVEPSTTVVIDTRSRDDPSAGIRRIAVRSGSVRAGLARGRRRSVEVQLPDGETIAVRRQSDEEEADVRIQVADDGGTEVAVTRGAVALTTPTGRTVDVLSGTSLDLLGGEPGAPQPLPSTPVLEPLGGATPRYVDMPVELSWSVEGNPSRFRVELDRADTPAPIDALVESRARSVAWTPSAAATWSIRVVAVDDRGRHSPPSAPRRAEVVVDERLRLLLAPPDGATYRIASGRAEIELSWAPHPEGGPYRVTVAEDDALRDVITTRETDQTRTSVRLGPGVAHWGVHRGDEPLFVDSRQLHVERRRSDLRVPRRLDWSR